MSVGTNKQFIVSINMSGYDITNLEEVIQKVITKKLKRYNSTNINVRELDGDDHHYFMSKLMKKPLRNANDI